VAGSTYYASPLHLTRALVTSAIAETENTYIQGLEMGSLPPDVAPPKCWLRELQVLSLQSLIF
jgi:hypothetical protein